MKFATPVLFALLPFNNSWQIPDFHQRNKLITITDTCILKNQCAQINYFQQILYKKELSILILWWLSMRRLLEYIFKMWILMTWKFSMYVCLISLNNSIFLVWVFMFFGLFLLSNARPKMWSGVMRLEFQIEFTGRPSGFIVELFSLKSSVLKLVVLDFRCIYNIGDHFWTCKIIVFSVCARAHVSHIFEYFLKSSPFLLFYNFSIQLYQSNPSNKQLKILGYADIHRTNSVSSVLT